MLPIEPAEEYAHTQEHVGYTHKVDVRIKPARKKKRRNENKAGRMGKKKSKNKKKVAMLLVHLNWKHFFRCGQKAKGRREPPPDFFPLHLSPEW